MTTRDFFMQRWEAEQRAFVNVLRALPENQLGYRPHEKCTPAGALAYQLADEQKQLSDLLDKGEARIEIKDHPKKVSDIVSQFEKAGDDLRSRMKNVNDAKWASKANLVMNGQTVWSDSVENMFWGYLFDMVHHRGQLSAYLRPMGGKVPAIYGPSADDMGGA